MMESSAAAASNVTRGLKRRQNRSCDSCRRGKRRCDVQVDMRDGSILAICSNCRKWEKDCTIQWLRSRERRLGRSPQGDSSRAPSFERTEPPELCFIQVEEPWRTTKRPPEPANQPSGMKSHVYQTGPLLAPKQTSWTSYSPASMSVGTTQQVSANSQRHDSMSQQNRPHISRDKSRSMDDRRPTSMMLTPRSIYHVPGYNGSTFSIGDGDDGRTDNDELFGRGQLIVSANESRQTSPFGRLDTFNRSNILGGSQILSEDYNRVQIRDGLLKIYHDSLEGALSCWLTERNCPYSVSVFDGRNVWSRTWANRMFARVNALDNAYIKAGLLSLRDQQQASKVLNAVVMAFSAQWSHTGQRAAEEQTDNGHPRGQETGVTTGPSESGADHDKFGRHVQSSLWHEAKRVLSEASDNMSFKVIFAGIIFSLTQRPVDATELSSKIDINDDNLSSLFSILDLDGPTVTLDAALRKLQDHQRNLRQAKFPTQQPLKAPAQLSREDQETFGLLYWLANMFDSISATMNRRSFTISDADSRRVQPHVVPSLQQPNRPPLSTASNFDGQTVNCSNMIDTADLWGSFFMTQRSPVGDVRKHNVRWPCSYLDAAACLTDAAPVKVLLYRRVGQLQALFYQNASPQFIERCLESVLEVYNHWNESYGLFIGDCIIHHERLPVRVQSWYTLLAGHWNLAVLILADLMDTLENAGMTMPFQRDLRKSMGLMASIRDNAVITISDLGFHSRRGNEEPFSFSKSADFHHAVNQAALLTEPWTVVLVRAFSHAGAILAERVKAQRFTSDIAVSETDSEPKRRLQYCIDALSLLGRKSDMAMCAAKVLRKVID